MGQVPGPVLLVQNVDDVAALTLPGGHPGGLYHPDHAQRGRHKGHNCRPSRRVLQIFKALTSGISAMRHRTANLR